jgi:hypothetical protein
VDDAKVDVLARIEARPPAELHDLAVDEPTKRREQIAQHRARGRCRRPLEGMRQEEIARQHAHRVAPDTPRRRLAPAFLPVVHDVVVKQRRQVNELRGHRHVAGDRRDGPEARRRQEHRQRPYSLATRLEQVGRRIRAGGSPFARHPGELPVDQRQVVAEERVHLGDAVGGPRPRPLGGGGLAKERDGGGCGGYVQNYLKVI